MSRLSAVLEQTLARYLAWIAAADTKTGFIFAIDTAMLGLLAASAPSYGKWTRLGVAMAIAGALPLLVSLALLTVAVFPRTRGPRLSIVFFGGVAARTLEDFRDDVLALDDSGYIEDLIQQCHINALIASTKYEWVKRAGMLLYVSVVPWIAATYVLFRDRA